MELPFFFDTDLDSSIFTPDVVFQEPNLPPIRGIQNYKRFLRSLRDSACLVFEEPTFDVIRATHHAEQGLVKVRWKISGKYVGPLKFFGKGSVGSFDGISYYFVEGNSGLVSVHQVDYQTPIMTPKRAPTQDALLWSQNWAGLVAPIPAVPALRPLYDPIFIEEDRSRRN